MVEWGFDEEPVKRKKPYLRRHFSACMGIEATPCLIVEAETIFEYFIVSQNAYDLQTSENDCFIINVTKLSFLKRYGEANCSVLNPNLADFASNFFCCCAVLRFSTLKNIDAVKVKQCGGRGEQCCSQRGN